jgi:protein SCO1/2
MRNRLRSPSSAGAALLALLVALAAGASDDPKLKAGVFEPPRAAPDFSLQGSDGKELKLSRYRGKVVILEFGFTSCPDVCPTTLAALAQARKRLVADGKDVQVLYVTVDPERDDAAQMRKYLANFDPSFVGGTGTAEQLEAVQKEYGIAAKRVSAGNGYAFDHSSFTYLIDGAGKLRALMPYGHAPADYVHDVKVLLNP